MLKLDETQDKKERQETQFLHFFFVEGGSEALSELAAMNRQSILHKTDKEM